MKNIHENPSADSLSSFTIGQGNTPLVRSHRIGPNAGLDRLYFKLESTNPTGSYKDRFAAAAIGDMRRRRQTLCLGTSSGNTGAALAACCAAADIRCLLVIVDGAPTEKLLQMRAYGAKLLRVRGFAMDARVTARVIDFVVEAGRRPRAAVQISAYRYSPIGMAGVESISWELAMRCERPVEHVFCPAGGGGLTLAMARGFDALHGEGKIDRRPRIHCVQPEGNDTIASALRDGGDFARPVTCATAISGLQVPAVIDGDAVIHACRASGGTGHIVTDDEVLNLQRRLAREEGVFCEPAGAATLAGALLAKERGEIGGHDEVVCLVTGSGFKDQVSMARMAEAAGEVALVSADVDELPALLAED